MSIPNSETNNGVPYTHLPESDNDSGNTPARCRKTNRSTFIILTGLVAFLLFFVAVKYGNNDGTDDIIPGPVPPHETVCNMIGSNLMPLTTMRTVARGVEEGVSAKSHGHFLGVRPFPWTQKMLAWQRTSFHFQPKKNWMNG